MKRSNRAMILCTLALPFLLIGGCGSNDSSPDASGPVRLSGVVEDGVIANARISLRDSSDGDALLLHCGVQGLSRCETTSDADGGFSLDVPAGIDLTSLTVVAAGGRDRDTGVDFTGLELRTPLALHAADQSAIVTSPLTTLVAILHAQGLPLVDAQERVRDWLALPPTTKLTVRPTASLDLQRRALLLTKIALELQALAPGENPFGVIGEKMAAGMPLLAMDGASNPAVLTTLGLVDSRGRERVIELQKLLAAAPDVAAAENSLKKKELMDILAANIRVMLSDAATFDETNADYQLNLKVLAETALRAAEAGGEVIPLGGTIAQRIARYILFTYDLRTPATLTLGPADFAAKLQQGPGGLLLESDPRIAELARSRSLYSVVSPLLQSELPGNDNQKRLAYFYGSDLSPHYQAEQLIGRVFDDAINDAVILEIVEGKANAGLIDEVQTIIATQMVQSEQKANAYRALANALIKYHRLEEARTNLDLARDLYRNVVIPGHNGATLTITTDVANLLATATSYRQAGDLLNAQSLLQDVADIATALASNTALIYGNLITGIKNVADLYIAAGDLDAAAPLVKAMDDLSGLTPALAGTYKLRIYNWSESARRYADLGDGAMVLQVAEKIRAQRAADAASATATWVYVPSLVESLYRVGKREEALALANSLLPSGSTYLGAAFKLVATYEALNGNMEGAFSLVQNSTYFPKAEDKLELLTYYAANEKQPYIALSLINAGPGRYADARLALISAEEILTGVGMTASTNLARIRYGYVKLARLYTLMGDTAKAASLLESARGAMIDDIYHVTVMVDLALADHDLGETESALTLLASARSLADSDPTRYRADTTPNLGTAEASALLYETLIKAYEKMGQKVLVASTLEPFLTKALAIHTAGTVDDTLAGKECDYLLRAALYYQRADRHAEALNQLAAAKGAADQIAVAAKRLSKYLSVIKAYAALHEDEQALSLALAIPLTTERNQAIQALANAVISRNDFPASAVASIDTDRDGRPDFFHPLASAEEIAASGLILDDDSDGDTLADTSDFRPLFVDLIKE